MKKRQKNKNPYQNKTSYEFIRWGTLGLQIHKEASLPGNSEDRDFHIAPTKKGIYAFPKGYVETFLLGVSPENMIPGKDLMEDFSIFVMRMEIKLIENSTTMKIITINLGYLNYLKRED